MPVDVFLWDEAVAPTDVVLRESAAGGASLTSTDSLGLSDLVSHTIGEEESAGVSDAAALGDLAEQVANYLRQGRRVVTFSGSSSDPGQMGGPMGMFSPEPEPDEDVVVPRRLVFS